MDDTMVVLTVVTVASIFAGGVWLLFRRPTGPRIVRFARRYMAEHPGAAPGDLRDALRQQFLGGVGPIDWAVGNTGQSEGQALAAVAEGVRDRWFPLDRGAIAAKIEAAVAIAGTPGEQRLDPEDPALLENRVLDS